MECRRATRSDPASRPILAAAIALLILLIAIAPAPAEPVGVWDAADIEGETWRDTSGHERHGRIAGAAVESALGRKMLALGPERSVEVQPLGDGWSALTVLAVVHHEQTKGDYQGLVCRDVYGGPAGDVFGLVLDPEGRWTARVKTSAGQATASAPASAGWHQIALAYDGQALRLYVDGKPADEARVAGALVAEPETPLVFGSYSNRQGWLRGGLARVELHDEALSAEQIAVSWRDWLAAHPEDDAFSFAVGADIHMTDTRSVEIVNDAVDRINADPRIAFSLWLGDLTRAATADEMVLARLALDRLRRPRYAVRGNHDQQGDAYEREFGPLMQSFTYGGWKFLLIDTNPGDGTPLAEEQREWIRDQLKQTGTETPLVLCGHHPLMPHTKAYRLAGADEVLALFEGHNLKAALAGHFHGNQEEVVDGVLFTTTACLATTRGNHDGTTAKGFRLFHCRDGEITTEFVPVRDEAKAEAH